VIIDSHAHLKHGDAAATEYSAARIVKTMDSAGIDKAVVFAMSTTTRRSVEMATAAVNQFPDRLIPYVYALPDYRRPVARDLEDALVKRGFRGIKLHAAECRISPYTTDAVFEIAGELKVPVLVDFCGNAGAAKRVAAEFPNTALIIAHIGQYLCTDDAVLDLFIEIAESHPNAYLDVSGMARLWKVADAVRRVGSGKVVWGTDGPQATPDEDAFARAELSKMMTLGLSSSAESDVLGGTVARLLGLDTQQESRRGADRG
jgi:hypothetical protein